MRITTKHLTPLIQVIYKKIIDNEGGYIEFSTDRMRRAGSLPYIIRDVGDISAAVRRRLDEIADNPYFEFGHQKAALNVLLDDNAANRANYMRQAMPEEGRSIIETRFRGNTLDDLLDNGFEGVEFNRVTDLHRQLKT